MSIIHLKKRAKTALASVFMTAVFMAGEGQAQKIITNPYLKTSKKMLGGSFDGLRENGRPYDESKLEGKTLLVYFGTEYRLPTCSNDLKYIYRAAEEVRAKCPDIADNLELVFIAPEYDGGQEEWNRNYAEEHGFTVLQADMATVKSVARQYGAMYLQTGGLADHTKYIYFHPYGEETRTYLDPQPLPRFISMALGCD